MYTLVHVYLLLYILKSIQDAHEKFGFVLNAPKYMKQNRNLQFSYYQTTCPWLFLIFLQKQNK